MHHSKRYSVHDPTQDRNIRDQLLKVEAFDITPRTCNAATTSLVYALSLHMMLENSDAMHSIEEMSVLCCELLSTDALEQELNAIVGLFAGRIIRLILDTSGSGQHREILTLIVSAIWR